MCLEVEAGCRLALQLGWQPEKPHVTSPCVLSTWASLVSSQHGGWVLRESVPREYMAFV